MEPYNLPPSLLIVDCTDEQLLGALKWERYQADRLSGKGGADGKFLAGLEEEWRRRNLCSRCLRELDQPLADRMQELAERASNAEAKLGSIRKAAMEKPDIILRPEIVKILDEP